MEVIMPTAISTTISVATRSPMPKGNQMAKLFPVFDHLHFRYLKQNRRATGNPYAAVWTEFLEKTGISWTVLYPTAGLAVGRIMAPDWAMIACRAYNTWLHEKFLTKNPRLKGVGLIRSRMSTRRLWNCAAQSKSSACWSVMLPSTARRFRAILATKFIGRSMRKRKIYAAVSPSTSARSPHGHGRVHDLLSGARLRPSI